MTPSQSAEPLDESMVRFGREWPALLAIVVFVVVMMWPFTLGGQALMPDTWRNMHPWARGPDAFPGELNVFDPVLEFDPWFRYSQQCLMEGRVPHWNPWQFCGTPLYANRLVPFFFPPFIVAELVASPPKIIGWFQLFNLILSGWGMYFLLRRWRLSASVGAVSSCLYLTTSLHFLPHPVWTLGTIGFPWLLWALEGFIQRPSLRKVGLAGLIAGLILMVGYPVTVVHLSYMTAVFFIARWVMLRGLVRPAGRFNWLIPVATLAVVYLLGFGVSAIANLPTMAYYPQTVRVTGRAQDPAYEQERRHFLISTEAKDYDPEVARLVSQQGMLVPIKNRAKGYTGVLIYLFAILGLIAGRSPARLLGALGVLFAIVGLWPGLYLLLVDTLPGWGVSIMPPFDMVNFLACLLVGFGIEAVTGRTQAAGRLGLGAKIFFIVLATIAVLLTAFVLALSPIGNLLALGKFYRLYLAGVVLVCALGAVLLFLRGGVHWLRWGCISAMLVVSLAGHWYLQRVYSPPDYMPETGFTHWLKSRADEEPDRFGGRLARWADVEHPLQFKQDKGPFPPNLQMRLGMQDVGGYDSLILKRYMDYCDSFEQAFTYHKALIRFREPSTLHHPRFLALGVRWIISLGELPEEARAGCSLVWDDRRDNPVENEPEEVDDFVQVWEVDDPEPRAFLTRNVVYTGPSDNPLETAERWEREGMRVVVVENPEAKSGTCAFSEQPASDETLELPGGKVRFDEDEPEYVRISVEAPQDCYLVLRDGWYSEWQAWVDGGETSNYPADNAFRAVQVPAGEHLVEFRYVPRSFRIGAWITTVALLVLLILGLVSGKVVIDRGDLHR